MRPKTTLQNGQVLVEFAFVLPILVILVLGIIEFGIVFYNKAMVTNASREGARTGIVLQKDSSGNCIPVPDSAIEKAVTDYLQAKLINFGDGSTSISTTISRNGNCPDQNPGGGDVTVTVSYNHSFLVIPKFLGLGDTITLAGETVMRRE